jgi:hypothetical protein
MKATITIQELDSKTMGWIKQKATQRGITPEALVIELIHKSIQSEQTDSPLVAYRDAESLAGTWDEAAMQEFLGATADFDQMDKEFQL